MLATPLRLVSELPDDARLVEAVGRGDASVAVALYDRLRPTVSRTVRKLVPRSFEHDDLVQQAFVEVVTALKARPAVRSLDAWASTLTARVVYRRLRRERLEARFALVEDEGSVVEDAVAAVSDPHEAARLRQTLQRVAAAMARLSGGRMQVFLLHDVHGYALKEIAEILGLTVSNVQTRLVRGRRELHEALAQDPATRHALGEEEPR